MGSTRGQTYSKLGRVYHQIETLEKEEKYWTTQQKWYDVIKKVAGLDWYRVAQNRNQ